MTLDISPALGGAKRWGRLGEVQRA